jgi:hypothetical protein
VKKIALAILVFAGAIFSSAQAPSSVPANAHLSRRRDHRHAHQRHAHHQAVRYRLQGGTKRVDFRGTDLLESASGEARVEGKLK